jgi:hypothetical protein
VAFRWKDKRIIKKKAKWIKIRLQEEKQIQALKERNHMDGDQFSFLGVQYPIKITQGKARSVQLIGGKLNVVILKDEPHSGSSIKNLLVDWFIAKAKVVLFRKTKIFAAQIGVKPKNITIKDYKSKWGSCSISGNISYNWRIIMAPNHVIDYLVIHELCHMLEHNHSQDYWKHVSDNCKHFKDSKNWLKAYGRELLI